MMTNRTHTWLIYGLLLVVLILTPGASVSISNNRKARQAEQILHLVVNATRVTKKATLIADTDWNIIHANNKAGELLGTDKYTLRQMNVNTFLSTRFDEVSLGTGRIFAVRDATKLDGSLISVIIKLDYCKLPNATVFVVSLTRGK